MGPQEAQWKFLDGKIAVGRMGFDRGPHCRLAALGTKVAEIKGEGHGESPFALGELRTLKRVPVSYEGSEAPCDGPKEWCARISSMSIVCTILCKH
jgi:hypothetical protein